MKEYCTQQLCEVYGVSRNTVGNWRKKGLKESSVDSSSCGSDAFLYRLSDVDAFLVKESLVSSRLKRRVDG